MTFYALDDKTPTTPQSGNWWAAPDAQIIGDVKFEENASIWFGVVARGDNERITIGENSNVQDNSVLHTDMGYPLTIGKDCVVGHLAMLHGCQIDDNSLIGMGAVVMNGAKIGKNCLIGAQAFIKEGMEIPDNSMVLGQPGKIVREVSEEVAQFIHMNAAVYVENWQRFKSGLKPLDTQ